MAQLDGYKNGPIICKYFHGFPQLEGSFLKFLASDEKPLIWIRYIDDIFLIWTHGEGKFIEFINKLNSFHPTIKYMFCVTRFKKLIS